MANFELSSNSGDDTLDIRDIIQRVEKLRSMRDDFICKQEESRSPLMPMDEDAYAEIEKEWKQGETEDAAAEWVKLEEFLDKVKGRGGDERWEGAWYPGTLILDSYFEEYVQDLAEEIGASDKDARWPCNHIDWEAAANELQQEYSSAELLEGEAYWYRVYWYRGHCD